jgi:hypothetical protein
MRSARGLIGLATYRHPEKQAMNERRNHASVTDVDCTCGYLERAADNPDVPIQFEASTGEYQFTYQTEAWGPSMLVIYHCPFCGGAAPESKRALLFHAISDAEEGRLKELFLPIKTIADALERLGEPDSDVPFGGASMRDKADGQPLSIQYERMLRYGSLSEIADFEIIEASGG